VDQLSSPPKSVDILGTSIATTSYEDVLRAIGKPPAERAQLFAFCNVHSVMTARRDRDVRAALDLMDVASPDGMPLVWVLRRRGRTDQPRVYGPDLMEFALPYGVDLGWQHFFFGTTDETLDRLTDSARRMAPGVSIVGRYAPPYRPLTPSEEDHVIERIRRSGANVVWVGLGMPKQELWMHRVRDRLPGISVLGVGAAFDLLSGTVPQAPDWFQERGLEWAYRLWREPRRLWRRYLINNPAFAILVLRDEYRFRQSGRAQ